MHQHHNHEPAGGAPVDESDKAICPVTHMAVSKQGATTKALVRNYKDQTYYFCCNGCTALFDKNPAQYAASEKGSNT